MSHGSYNTPQGTWRQMISWWGRLGGFPDPGLRLSAWPDTPHVWPAKKSQVINNLICSVTADSSLFILNPPALKFLALCSTSISAFELLCLSSASCSWTLLSALLSHLILVSSSPAPPSPPQHSYCDLEWIIFCWNCKHRTPLEVVIQTCASRMFDYLGTTLESTGL